MGGRNDPKSYNIHENLAQASDGLTERQFIRIGHYNKALNEDAINGANFKPQWPKHWDENPLARGGTFHTLTPERRLDLLYTLTLWALGYSDAVKSMINASYNGKRTNDDLNQPLSVQPWGVDSDKRRYYLVEGDDNCSFRVYREGNPAALYNRQWISVAGSIDEVKQLANKLATVDGGPNARKLGNNILKNVVNFEEKEEKRKRREYRRQQKERFRRPEPGFSLYEGRTRGKRVKYTYSDEEDFYTDSTNRRSTRNTRNPTPVESGPIVTASGRQSRPPPRLTADNMSNGDVSTAPSIQGDAMDIEMSEAPDFGPTGRPRRSAAVHHGTNGWANPRKRRKDFVSDDEDDDESELDLGDDEEDHIPQYETDDAEEFENDVMDDDDKEIAADSPGSNDSRVVKLHIKVKFDKHGKAKRLLDDNTPAVTSPSNIGSSPSTANEASEDSPSDEVNLEPDRTEDVVNVAPLTGSDASGSVLASSSEIQTLDSAASAPLFLPSASSDAAPSSNQQPPPSSLAAASIDAADSIRKTSGVLAAGKENLSPSSLTQTPCSPRPGAPASLAFRGSPEKAQPALQTVTSSLGQD